MLILLLSCISFIWVFNTICCKPIPLFSTDLKSLFKPSVGKMVELIDDREMYLLDLPDLAMDNILEKLSPVELRNLAGVCSNLRQKCRSDHLWETHMKQKWGRVIGEAAFRDWECHLVSSNRMRLSNWDGFFGFISRIWPLSLVRSITKSRSKSRGLILVDDSIMARYLSLENGNFWFPAQVYNRENGHGFLLSCYDAELRYNSATDTFQARYSPLGRHTVEDNISWDRLRVAPVDTPANVLHVSGCLEDLKPGDHFEIQWRRNKDFPYGWWYGVVGHLDSCIRNEDWCQCHESNVVMLEFNQYPVDSRWRRTTVNRKDHREEGNEADGFYGGIRKLYDTKEIATWKSIWPKNALEL